MEDQIERQENKLQEALNSIQQFKNEVQEEMEDKQKRMETALGDVKEELRSLVEEELVALTRMISKEKVVEVFDTYSANKTPSLPTSPWHTHMSLE